MKRHPLQFYSLIAVILALAFSCKKENNVFPQVQILAPTPGGKYSYGDTLRLSFETAKSEGAILVNLIRGETVVSLPKQLVNEAGNRFEYELYFTDRYLADGNYDIRVKAFNGKNSGSDFVSIGYTELPLRLKGLVGLTGGQGGQPSLIKYDSLGNLQTLSLNGDYPYLAHNSFQGRTVTAPSQAGVLQGFDFKNFTKAFEVDNPALPGLPQYEYLLSEDNYIYAFENSGTIRGFNAAGSVARSYGLPAGYTPQLACAGEPGMLVAAREDGKSVCKLFLLNPQNGSVAKQIVVPGKVKAITYAGRNLFVVAYEKNGNAVISTYQAAINVLTVYGTINKARPLCLLALGDNLVYCSSNTQILRFDPHLAQLPVVVYGFAATDMEFDEVGKSVYYASGHSLLKGPPGGATQQLFTTPDSIQQIELVYNK